MLASIHCSDNMNWLKLIIYESVGESQIDYIEWNGNGIIMVYFNISMVLPWLFGRGVMMMSCFWSLHQKIVICNNCVISTPLVPPNRTAVFLSHIRYLPGYTCQ